MNQNSPEREHRDYRYSPIPSGGGTVGIELQELAEMEDTGEGEHFIREGRPLYTNPSCMRSKRAVTALCLMLVLVLIIALGVGVKIDQPSTTLQKVRDFAFRGKVKILMATELTPETAAQLHDPSSTVFITLAKQIKESMEEEYKKSSLADAYRLTEVKRLRKGIVCNFVIHFRATREPDVQTVRSVIAHSTSLGQLTIDPKFTTLDRYVHVHVFVPTTTVSVDVSPSVLGTITVLGTPIATTTTDSTTTTSASTSTTTSTGTTAITTSPARPTTTTTTMTASAIGDYLIFIS
ncbi:Hypp8114 [Branchiostoma lanceolatum]|uniref:Hypp8114 protein n=1 Tax=Branchiostoma lanceolatum TaxID=7740 RepID=A0A8J9Z5Z0_BRALA|nr:Hypp8114 [Branchiostoma lanceolatum]